jgi:class 3 adenylate cyclase
VAKEPGKERFEAYLKAKGSRLGTAIHDMWESRDESAWAKDPYFFIRLGEVASDLGQSMFAHDVLGEGLRVFPGHVRLTQVFSLQLIKCGFLLTARDLLTGLMNQGHFDEETLGILGRVHKEMWLIEGDGAADHPHLARSRELYVGAFRRSRGPYSGINAASLSLIMGDKAVSERLARDVIRLCAEAWKDPARRDYWTLATLAEGFLLLGRQETAAKYCRLARGRSDRTYSNLASTRRQFTLLSRYAPVDPQVLEALRIPPVVAFSGHRVDPPGQGKPHFPEAAADPVKRRIADALERLDARIGYASAACGGDVLFHECLQERSGESNVVLPFDRGDFFETSVNAAGIGWIRRAEQVLERSTLVEQVTRGGYGGEDLLFSYANRLILGKAILRSRFLQTEPLLLAVWDGARNGKPGGTAECIALWEETGFPSLIIDPSSQEVTEHPATAARRSAPRRRAPRRQGSEDRRRIVSILFADLVGFSRLREEQIPGYVQGFLRAMAEAVDRTGTRPEYRNTWGDAICFVFNDPISAAGCAIAMRDAVRNTDWERKGLPRDLAMRIGLHAGPVYRVREPLLDRPNFFGFHMNQAARIEPITRPGNVYASEAFASLLLADRRNTLDCRYVGVIVLPKEFGSYPIYHIKRTTEVG